ncbi:MAG TPA: MFS transporter [Candidatus Binatia bacterium]|nr:MFS transporter [Candidatus Binatia bacterium]
MTKALIPIYGITFIGVLGYTIMIPVLPYLAQHYAAPDIVVGLLMTTMAICSSISAPVWGAMSDRFGRKPIVMISQLFSLVGYLLLALATSLGVIFLSRAISGLGGGNVGVAQSYIADVTAEEHRGEAYAYFGVAFGMGFIIGPVLGGVLVRLGFDAPFYAAAALELVNIGFTLLFLPAGKLGRSGARRSVREVVRAIRMPAIRSLFGRQFLFIFAVTYFFTIFALYLKHVLDLGPSEVAWLLAGAGLIGAAVQLGAIGKLTERFGARAVSNAGFALGLIAYALLAFVTGLWTFVFVLVLWALGAALVSPTLTSLLSEAAPVEERGVVMGLNDSINNAALIIAPAIGAAVSTVNPRLVGIAPAVAASVALVLGLGATSRRKVRASGP